MKFTLDVERLVSGKKKYLAVDATVDNRMADDVKLHIDYKGRKMLLSVYHVHDDEFYLTDQYELNRPGHNIHVGRVRGGAAATFSFLIPEPVTPGIYYLDFGVGIEMGSDIIPWRIGKYISIK